jgi:hypothetical protein
MSPPSTMQDTLMKWGGVRPHHPLGIRFFNYCFVYLNTYYYLLNITAVKLTGNNHSLLIWQGPLPEIYIKYYDTYE